MKMDLKSIDVIIICKDLKSADERIIWKVILRAYMRELYENGS